MLELGQSPFAANLPQALFLVVRKEDREDICVAQAAGLSLLRQLERERLKEH